MIGIYKITNLVTGRCYIGQSKDIDERFKQHFYHSDSIVDKNLKLYGKDHFKFEVLEVCNENELDEKEAYYIRKYNSIMYGYNLIQGGQHNIGESNPNSKLTEIDIYNIREMYKNHNNKRDVYSKYSDKISEYYFSNLWEGKSWTNIHMDVYTKENIDYYKYKTSVGENSFNSKFTDQEVMELRTEYINKNAREIYESVKDKCSYNTLQSILWGRYYKHLPVYDKKNKMWKN